MTYENMQKGGEYNAGSFCSRCSGNFKRMQLPLYDNPWQYWRLDCWYIRDIDTLIHCNELCAFRPTNGYGGVKHKKTDCTTIKPVRKIGLIVFYHIFPSSRFLAYYN